MTSTMTTYPGRFGVLRRFAAAAAFAVASLFGGGTAEAGEPVKLLVELPPDVKSLDCGETLDIQIVGLDSAGARVAFGGRKVETSATAGSVELVKEPYQFRYRTPATLPDITNVRLRAWLKEAPEISGEVVVQVIPPAPFKRLVLQGPGSSPAGATADLLLRGETADGQLLDVPENTVTVRVEGPGTVAYLRNSRYRYESPANATGTAKIVAALNRYPSVGASLDILITGGAAPAPTPTPAPPPKNPPGGNAQPPAPPPPVTPPVPPKPGTKPGADDNDEPVAWPGGNVRVEVWRVKDLAEEEWSKEKDLVKPGADFASPRAFQKVRVATLRTDIKSVELEETVVTGDKTVTKKLTPSKEKEGRYMLVERASHVRAIHFECEIPEAGRQVTMKLTLTYNDGKQSTDTFVLKRVAKK